MKGVNFMSAESNKLYDALYQNAEMGTSSIKQIFPKVTDTKLKNELRKQLTNYQAQENTIIGSMKPYNMKPEPLSAMAKVMSKVGITLNCAKDNSTEHIAEMLIQGTNMGIIKINKALNHTVTASPRLVEEAKDMLTKEQAYIDNLKGYL